MIAESIAFYGEGLVVRKMNLLGSGIQNGLPPYYIGRVRHCLISPRACPACPPCILGIIDGKQLRFRAVLLVFQRTDVPGISRNADDAFIIGRNPDVALPILADVTDVAVAEVILAFFHGQEVARIVGVHDTHTIAASYPHGFILRFENGIDEIVLDVFCIATILARRHCPPPRFDDDAVVVDGKPDFTIASLGNTGRSRGKRIVVQAAKAWNLPDCKSVAPVYLL